MKLILWIFIPLVLPLLIYLHKGLDKQYLIRFAKYSGICILCAAIPMFYVSMIFGYPACIIASAILASFTKINREE